MVEWLAINHGPTIAVTAICPTLVDTPMAVEFDTLLEPLPVESVVAAAVDGIEAGTFLVTPAPVALDMLKAKVADYDGFLAQLQERVAAMKAAQDEG